MILTRPFVVMKKLVLIFTFISQVLGCSTLNLFQGPSKMSQSYLLCIPVTKWALIHRDIHLRWWTFYIKTILYLKVFSLVMLMHTIRTVSVPRLLLHMNEIDWFDQHNPRISILFSCFWCQFQSTRSVPIVLVLYEDFFRAPQHFNFCYFEMLKLCPYFSLYFRRCAN